MQSNTKQNKRKGNNSEQSGAIMLSKAEKYEGMQSNEEQCHDMYSNLIEIGA